MPEVLRPLSLGDVLDGAFTLYRRNFATFFLTALIPLAPVALAWLVVPPMLGGGDEMIATMQLLIMPYSLFAWLLISGGITHGGSVAWSGGTPTTGSLLGTGLRRLPAVAVTTLASYFLIMLGFLLLIIPGFILVALTFAVVPAVIVERLGPFAAIGRSSRLSKGARGRILAALIVGWIIIFLPTFAISFFFGFGAAAAAGAGATEGVRFVALLSAGTQVLSALTTPFLPLVSLLLYYDRRARTEAPDIEAALTELTAELS